MKTHLIISLVLILIPTICFAGLNQFGVIPSIMSGTAIQNGTTIDIPSVLQSLNGFWFLDNYLVNFGLVSPAVPTQEGFVVGSLSGGYIFGSNSAIPRPYFMLGGENKWTETESHGAFITEGGFSFPYYPVVIIAGIQYGYTTYEKTSEVKGKIGIALRWGGTAPVAIRADMAAGGETSRGFFPVR